ncbi:DUF736 domain-containing protein [Mesorhizobium sp. AR10]|uniref:DUF736 domain-containing protein n=1 Tax=Mesorhizobium sp. AR10 TaxID=2865839 RepID=UPI00216031AC|nr:DUF736 domain-containing protein [Mesorhizobium sp. AR10]UVK40572.1 DUF736 domain-containing protein [Mesorhizobium sp. AR10]
MAQAIPHCHRVKERIRCKPTPKPAISTTLIASRSASPWHQTPGVEATLSQQCLSVRQTDYHSVKLDDPSFPAPIYPSLVETDTAGDFSLIWSRRTAE